MQLRTNPDFPWHELRWGRPEEQISHDCSLCGVRIPEDDCPLRMWKDDGSAIVLCDLCAEMLYVVPS
jgi:hypothetical protein